MLGFTLPSPLRPPAWKLSGYKRGELLLDPPALACAQRSTWPQSIAPSIVCLKGSRRRPAWDAGSCSLLGGSLRTHTLAILPLSADCGLTQFAVAAPLLWALGRNKVAGPWLFTSLEGTIQLGKASRRTSMVKKCQVK